MDLQKFAEWANAQYGVNCYQNEIFKNALEPAYEEFKNSTYNGVPFPIHYQDVLYQKFLRRYLRYVRTIVKMIPPPGSETNLSVVGAFLNDYAHQKHSLESWISQLIEKLED